MTDADLLRLRDLIPFAAMLGIELLEASPEIVRGRLEWTPERCTTGGVLQGGAIMALADNCGGICAFLNLPKGAQSTATIESKTNFLRAVRDGAINATTRPLHKGRALIVVETELWDDGDNLAAKVTQTTRLPADLRDVRRLRRGHDRSNARALPRRQVSGPTFDRRAGGLRTISSLDIAAQYPAYRVGVRWPRR